MTLCYLGLGSNLDNPNKQLSIALDAIKNSPSFTFISCSSLYHSAPVDGSTQPTFVNAVVAITTTLSPQQLLAWCKQQEQAQHRMHLYRWGPRTIDIDILLYGNSVYRSDTLTIPHPEMHHRDFVLLPLAEIAPELGLPNGKPLSDMISKIPKKTIIAISPYTE